MSKAPRVHLQQAWDDVGGLSEPGKMPSYSISIPAKYCNVGTKLRDVKGSTCENCYAFERGRYRFTPVKNALERRYMALESPTWSSDMALLINELCAKVPYFRWHDSGDIQSIDHLRAIVAVCEETPTINHWLPTREYKMVADYRKLYGEFPPNLVVRLSGHMVNQSPPTGYGLPVSSVTTTHSMTNASICEAYTRGGKCGPCRKCWKPSVKHVAYPIH